MPGSNGLAFQGLNLAGGIVGPVELVASDALEDAAAIMVDAAQCAGADEGYAIRGKRAKPTYKWTQIQVTAGQVLKACGSPTGGRFSSRANLPSSRCAPRQSACSPRHRGRSDVNE
jgi:hypothetical protein